MWLGKIKCMHVCTVVEVLRDLSFCYMYNLYVCMHLASYIGAIAGADPGGSLGSRDPLQKYIKEAKRVMYWYKNTLKCIIS